MTSQPRSNVLGQECWGSPHTSMTDTIRPLPIRSPGTVLRTCPRRHGHDLRTMTCLPQRKSPSSTSVHRPFVREGSTKLRSSPSGIVVTDVRPLRQESRSLLRTTEVTTPSVQLTVPEFETMTTVVGRCRHRRPSSIVVPKSLHLCIPETSRSRPTSIRPGPRVLLWKDIDES